VSVLSNEKIVESFALPHIKANQHGVGFIATNNTSNGRRETMTVVEQRKHHRYPLVRQAAGEFRLLTPTAAYPIDVIKDISSSGIRVYLDTCLAERLPISVEYVEPTLKLELNGMVAWCTAQEEGTDTIETFGRYVVGVQLFSPVLLMAMSGLY
jgi:hypothetical protein